MQRDLIRKIVLAAVGLLYVGLVYPLFTDLWHSKWLIEMHNEECEPMFLSFFVALGFFLLLAVRNPKQHRSLIAFAAWQGLAHSAVMIVQTIEAYRNGTPRDFTDVFVAGGIGLILLIFVPPKASPVATS